MPEVWGIHSVYGLEIVEGVQAVYIIKPNVLVRKSSPATALTMNMYKYRVDVAVEWQQSLYVCSVFVPCNIQLDPLKKPDGWTLPFCRSAVLLLSAVEYTSSPPPCFKRYSHFLDILLAMNEKEPPRKQCCHSEKTGQQKVYPHIS